MTDPQLTDLFAEGTAPERDAAFAARVNAGIGRERLRPWLALAARAVVLIAFALAIFFLARALDPVLALLAQASPRFMGVPAPLIAAVLLVGLALRVLPRPRLHLA